MTRWRTSLERSLSRGLGELTRSRPGELTRSMPGELTLSVEVELTL